MSGRNRNEQHGDGKFVLKPPDLETWKYAGFGSAALEPAVLKTSEGMVGCAATCHQT